MVDVRRMPRGWMLEKEYKYFEDHQDELLKQSKKRFIVIKDDTLVGEFDTQIDAVKSMVQQGHALGTFLVQDTSPKSINAIKRFHSRVYG
jgi:hypothetical protein